MNVPTLPAEVERTLEEHAFSEVRTEVGGLLIGTLEGGGASIAAALPALRAQAGQMHVTFTHDVWEHALTVLDRDHVGQRIVGWYHTHPGFGLFLSEYDRFVHREFFSDPRMVALVVDPVAGERGWFQDTGEQLELVAQEPTARAGTAAAAGDGRSSARVPALLAVPALLLAGAIGGYALGTGGQAAAPAAAAAGAVETAPARSSPAVTAAQSEIASLRQQVATLEAAAVPAPTSAGVRYRIRRGDSLSELAYSFYGSPAAWPDIAGANPGIDADQLAVGQVVCVPLASQVLAPPPQPTGGPTCP